MTPTDWILLGFTLLGFGEITREIDAAKPFRALVFVIATLCLGIGFLDNAGAF
jgi:hypothetical protein